jgi:hypothetical protein
VSALAPPPLISLCSCNRFRNLDRLIAAVNADGRVRARYSTPDEYAAAKQASNATWPTKFDDFFPYSSNEHEVWRYVAELLSLNASAALADCGYRFTCDRSGYFSSRPALKRNVREHEGYLQAARVLDFLNGELAMYSSCVQLLLFPCCSLLPACACLPHSSGGNGSSTEALWKAVSLLQHHDAVSGTSKQHVAYDYAQRLSQGWLHLPASKRVK